MNIGMITCNYFMRIYGYKEPENFNWGDMSAKWRAEFKKEDFLALAREIRDIGYDELEIWEPTFSHDVYTEDDAKTLAANLAAMGFKKLAYSIGGWTKNSVGSVDKAYKFAKALGSDIVAGCIIKDDADVILPVIEEAGKKYGLKYAIENHPSPNLSSPADVAEAMKPYTTIGANLDTGIYNQQGYDVLDAYRLLKGKVYHTHFKDTVKGAEACLPIGDGDAPLAELVKLFAADGFEYMLSVEFEYPEDPAPGLIKSIKYIKELLG
ncbi:MAG: sugar phosphate isomerase/epimerase [Clostridiales bacterium]|jgi:sugar phosphate isomerase/epimerase|nr:sugar phosphate isomerase/epimerase [Clostridiales bacterium]